MDNTRILQSIQRIERNERALKWLEEYGIQLTGAADQFMFDPRLKLASACTGASDAAEMLASYARRELPKLVQVCIQNCRNTIEMDKSAIREEASK